MNMTKNSGMSTTSEHQYKHTRKSTHMNMSKYTLQMWEHFTFKRKRRRKAYKVSGNSNRFSRKVLEQIKKSSDMSCDAYLMRRAYYAGKSGDCDGYKVAHWCKREIGETK